MFYDPIFLTKVDKWALHRPVIWKSKKLIVIPAGFTFCFPIPKWIWWQWRGAVVLRKYLGSDKVFDESLGKISWWRKYLIKRCFRSKE